IVRPIHPTDPNSFFIRVGRHSAKRSNKRAERLIQDWLLGVGILVRWIVSLKPRNWIGHKQ
ncbi:hypothetical protein, partial [Alicyclobacillus cycloheptanicus]|uniref:hypothetical protein n=1 Tax=Alicyclobacillus cycloheptanicus TaxID=1457 RepID=UPI00396791FA